MPGSWNRLVASTGVLALTLLALPAASHDVLDPDDPPKNWEARLALGGSLRAGDENRYAGNADGMVKRLWEQDTLTWRAFGNYGKTGGERDAEDFGTSLKWRHNFDGGRFFWLTGTEADHDAVQGRNLRLQAYTGPGYRIWEASDVRFFEVSTGAGYRHERFRGDEPNNDLFDLRAGYDYQDVIGEVLEVVHSTDVFAPANEIENFLARSELTLSVPLVGGLHFRNNMRYEYVNEPADDAQESNFWMTIGLEYRL